ncbi:MAG: hypothetical protein P8J37_00250 [Fuerstiella sp.]|nr:hypothetical protein [Fuerstiella sp.]
MLRKGLVTLMMTVMSVGSLLAEDGQKQNPLMDWLRGPSIGRPDTQRSRTKRPGGIRHAVVDDAARQVPEIRLTSAQPPSRKLEPAKALPQPLPIQYAPVVPNGSAISGPQYFSAANSQGHVLPVHPGANWQQYAAPQPVYQNSAGPYSFASSANYARGAGPVSMSQAGDATGAAGPSSAALYPAPKPGIPQQLGGTAIVHQAFHPHEMLYPHRYKAMYGPYYYKVNGGWMVTPFGVWSKENWKLQGTTVDVKYKSHISPLSMFSRPVIR